MEIELNSIKDKAEAKRIVSCINLIAQTPKGTVPYARDMGLERIYPKDNSIIAKNEYASDLLDQIDEWEERVIADEVKFVSDNEVKVVLKDG